MGSDVKTTETCVCGSTRIQYPDGDRRAQGPIHFGPGQPWPCLGCQEWVAAANPDRMEFTRAQLDAAVRDAVAAERERCAELCELEIAYWKRAGDMQGTAADPDMLALAIKVARRLLNHIGPARAGQQEKA